MSNIDDYNEKLDAILAISDDDAREPGIPIEYALQEAEDLCHWASDDLLKLAPVGIKKSVISDLRVRTGAGREAQSIWNKDYNSQKEAQKQWKALAPAAFELRDDLLAAMRFAYRKDETLLGRVRAIDEGTGNADMLQDLNDIKVLGQDNPESLTAITFDFALFETAGTTSDEMAEVLAAANGDRIGKNETKVIRDKAYTHMKELVDEIRDAGKYVFRKDKTRLKGYSSQYRKRHRSSNTNSDEGTNQVD